MYDLQRQIEIRQEECKKCIDEFNSFGTFSSTMCKLCSNGAELHRLEVRASTAEQKWGACDWNSAKLKDFYKG